MQLQYGKMAPTGFMIVVAGYWCWPFLDGLGAGVRSQEDKSLPEVTAELLSPKIDPPPERDPFHALYPGQITPVETQDPDAGGTVQDGDEFVTSGADAEKTPPASAEGDFNASERTANPLGGLTLNATFIKGDQRVALINGRPYMQGELLDLSNSSSGDCLVKRIDSYAVLIEHNGRTVELSYPQGLPADQGLP